MKFWTVQKRDVWEKVLADGCYQPDFAKSPYLQADANLGALYNVILTSFNKLNDTALPGLIFAFTETDNQHIYSIPDIDSFRDFISSNANAIRTLWKKLATQDNVILELEYSDDFNPIFIDINDFQFLMPPICPLYPYSEEDIPRLVSLIREGQVHSSIFPSGIMQAHLPNIRRENLVAAHEVFSLR